MGTVLLLAQCKTRSSPTRHGRLGHPPMGLSGGGGMPAARWGGVVVSLSLLSPLGASHLAPSWLVASVCVAAGRCPHRGTPTRGLAHWEPGGADGGILLLSPLANPQDTHWQHQCPIPGENPEGISWWVGWCFGVVGWRSVVVGRSEALRRAEASRTTTPPLPTTTTRHARPRPPDTRPRPP